MVGTQGHIIYKKVTDTKLNFTESNTDSHSSGNGHSSEHPANHSTEIGGGT